MDELDDEVDDVLDLVRMGAGERGGELSLTWFKNVNKSLSSHWACVLVVVVKLSDLLSRAASINFLDNLLAWSLVEVEVADVCVILPNASASLSYRGDALPVSCWIFFLTNMRLLADVRVGEVAEETDADDDEDVDDEEDKTAGLNEPVPQPNDDNDWLNSSNGSRNLSVFKSNWFELLFELELFEFNKSVNMSFDDDDDVFMLIVLSFSTKSSFNNDVVVLLLVVLLLVLLVGVVVLNNACIASSCLSIWL